MLRQSVACVLIAVVLASLAWATVAQDVVDDETAVLEDAAEAPVGGGLATGLRHLHAWTRWLVVVAMLLALLKLAVGYFTNDDYDLWARRLMLAFSLLITIQWLIGVVFFAVIGGFGVRYRWEHAAIMTVTVALAHLHHRWKHQDARTRYRNNLLIVLAVAVLVYAGVALLPQGWRVMPAV